MPVERQTRAQPQVDGEKRFGVARVVPLALRLEGAYQLGVTSAGGEGNATLDG